MHETSSLYKRLFSGTHRLETRVEIGGVDYGENVLMSVVTTRQVFSNDKPQVGCCVAGEIDLEMLKPAEALPRMARIVPYVRLTDGVECSEWIQKGVFYVDTRSNNKDDSGTEILSLHGYDAMLKAEQDYTGSNLAWPNTDINVVQDIARIMGTGLEAETAAKLNMAYTLQLPSGYACREVLGYIAAMYAGCFIMSDLGELKLVQLNGIPKETNYLIDRGGYAITFGRTRILV